MKTTTTGLSRSVLGRAALAERRATLPQAIRTTPTMTRYRSRPKGRPDGIEYLPMGTRRTTRRTRAMSEVYGTTADLDSGSATSADGEHGERDRRRAYDDGDGERGQRARQQLGARIASDRELSTHGAQLWFARRVPSVDWGSHRLPDVSRCPPRAGRGSPRSRVPSARESSSQRESSEVPWWAAAAAAAASEAPNETAHGLGREEWSRQARIPSRVEPGFPRARVPSTRQSSSQRQSSEVPRWVAAAAAPKETARPPGREERTRQARLPRVVCGGHRRV